MQTTEEEKRIIKKIKELLAKVEVERLELARISCPYSVGDKITDGKNTVIVSAIRIPKYFSEYAKYSLFGHKIKKNGDRYKRECDLYFVNSSWHVIKDDGGK